MLELAYGVGQLNPQSGEKLSSGCSVRTGQVSVIWAPALSGPCSIFSQPVDTGPAPSALSSVCLKA